VYAGHAALALLAKAKRTQVPLALLVPVAFAPDWIEWLFAASGHRNQQISHSLISVGIGAVLVAVVYAATQRDWSGALAVWLTYLSHWAADFVTGRKPTWPNGPTVGLYLYTKPFADAAIEFGVIAICWFVYRQSLPPESRRRGMGWLIPVGLVAMHVAFLAATNPDLRP
jgi:membrane-bound metal-dependent hydrolase YbcI (DUF457 family)